MDVLEFSTRGGAGKTLAIISSLTGSDPDALSLDPRITALLGVHIEPIEEERAPEGEGIQDEYDNGVNPARGQEHDPDFYGPVGP